MRIRLTLFALLIVGVLAFHVSTVAAVPASFDWGSFSATGSREFGVYDRTQERLQSGALVQLIAAGPDEEVDIPLADGTPGGDDRLLDTNRVENDGDFPPPMKYRAYVPLKTYTYDTEGTLNGGTVYLRAWNADSAASASAYGDSVAAVLTPGGTLNAPRWTTDTEPSVVTLETIGAAPARLTLLWVAMCILVLLTLPSLTIPSFLKKLF